MYEILKEYKGLNKSNYVNTSKARFMFCLKNLAICNQVTFKFPSQKSRLQEVEEEGGRDLYLVADYQAHPPWHNGLIKQVVVES